MQGSEFKYVWQFCYFRDEIQKATRITFQVAIEDDLRDSREVSFQAALLYTSSKGERRIRVHTLCVPTSANLNDVINGADEKAIVGMLAKIGNWVFLFGSGSTF